MKRGWFSVSETFEEHPKWERALGEVGPAAAGLWLLMVARCSRNLTDGILTDAAVKSMGRWQSKKAFERTCAILFDVGLITKRIEGGIEVVHYLEHQRSRASVEKELGRKAKNQQTYRDRHAPEPGVTPALPVTLPASDRSVTALEKSREEKIIDTSSSAPAAPTPDLPVLIDVPRADVAEVFEHWQRACGHPKVKLLAGDKRDSVIKRALKRYAVADLLKAIDGCARSDFHMARGEHTGRQRYDELASILADVAKIDGHIARAEGKGPSRAPARAANGGSSFDDEVFA